MRDCLDLLLQYALPTLSISRCWIIFSSRSFAYSDAARGILVFRRRDASRTIFGGVLPTMSPDAKSMINIRWLPIPYPAGIMEALHTVIFDVAQIPSIGFEPRKYVVPTEF